MSRRQYATLSLSLAAGEELRLALAGSYVACLEASAAFEFALGDDSYSDFFQGLKLRAAEPFQSIRLHNPGASALAVTLAVGDGDLSDSRLSATAPLEIKSPGGFASSADVLVGAGLAATVAAADPDRREVFVSSLASNTDPLRVRPVGGAGGLELLPGSTVILTTTAAVEVYNPAASGQTVAIVEVAA